MNTAQAKPYDVFLSFNSDDREAVENIAQYLKKKGLHPYFDEWELIPGESVIDNLARGISASTTCAMFIGQSGPGDWQKAEARNVIVQSIKQKNLRVIPVFLPDAPTQLEFPPFLAFLEDKKWIDFRGKRLDDEAILWQLECGIRGIPPGERRSDAQTEDQEPELTPLIDPGPLRDAYLSWLCDVTSRVFLSGIDPKAASREKDACLSLGAIYTALFTQTAEHKDVMQAGRLRSQDSPPGRGEGWVRLSAVAQLNQHKHLVLLGDPGSGKSTFVNFAAMCLSGAQLPSWEGLGVGFKPPD